MAKPLRFQHFEVLTRPDGSPHLLGKGAMGLTYKAFDRNLLSLVVVKVIAPELMGRPEARQRFLQEAQSMAKIKHPNVADVFFLGESPQGVFYAMEFCDGPSMQEYVEEHGPMDPADVLTLGLQAAQALQAVERHNLIHRDIKPSNMILINDAQGRSQIKLIDFGLARDILRDAARSQHEPGQLRGHADLCQSRAVARTGRSRHPLGHLQPRDHVVVHAFGAVTLRRDTPQNEAGVRRLPPRSEPVASATCPSARATAEPPDEPAQVLAGSKGLPVGP